MSFEREILKKINESKSLNEDWRDGKFEDKDFREYSSKMLAEVGRLVFSLNHMKKAHPQYAKEFDHLRKSMMDSFK